MTNRPVAFVVHPDPASRALVANTIALGGFEVREFADGEKAIDHFVDEPCELLVCEYFLGGRDGVATIQSIRWAPQGSEVAAVLLFSETPKVPIGELLTRVAAGAHVLGPLTPTIVAKACRKAQEVSGRFALFSDDPDGDVELPTQRSTTLPGLAELTVTRNTVRS